MLERNTAGAPPGVVVPLAARVHGGITGDAHGSRTAELVLCVIGLHHRASGVTGALWAWFDELERRSLTAGQLDLLQRIVNDRAPAHE